MGMVVGRRTGAHDLQSLEAGTDGHIANDFADEARRVVLGLLGAEYVLRTRVLGMLNREIDKEMRGA
jgi:hypothetical protein